jgi:hypothetical protein
VSLDGPSPNPRDDWSTHSCPRSPFVVLWIMRHHLFGCKCLSRRLGQLQVRLDLRPAEASGHGDAGRVAALGLTMMSVGSLHASSRTVNEP